MEFRNRTFNYIWNSCDLPVRFGYTQLGFLSKFLNKMLFWKLYFSDFKKLDEKFEKIFLELEKNNIFIKNKVVLELGPGNSYINAYNFLAKGAKKVILVDKYPRYIKTEKQRDFVKKELSFIKKKYGLEKNFFEDKIEVIGKELMEVEITDVDLIYSISVFEHIKDVSENIKKCYSILKQGGFMIHTIDMRDRYNFNRPFLFYKYSDKKWERYLTKEGLSYTNRWRCNDFKKEFEKNGFKIINANLEKFPMVERKIDSKFQKREDLGVGKVDFILKK